MIRFDCRHPSEVTQLCLVGVAAGRAKCPRRVWPIGRCDHDNVIVHQDAHPDQQCAQQLRMGLCILFYGVGRSRSLESKCRTTGISTAGVSLKSTIKRIAARFGIYLANVDRFGIDVDLDLARLTSTAPLQTIFDVGANIGQTACRYATAFPASKIYSFEPVPTSFQRLQNAVKLLPQVTTFNCALGERVGNAQIHLTSIAERNSMKRLPGAANSVEVQIDTIDRISATHQVNMIDLLKVDVEGFELSVLRGATTMLSSGRIRYIYAECVSSPNDEMPHTGFQELHEFLSNHGYCFVSYYAESFHLGLRCALGNVLYAFHNHLPVSVPGTVCNIV